LHLLGQPNTFLANGPEQQQQLGTLDAAHLRLALGLLLHPRLGPGELEVPPELSECAPAIACRIVGDDGPPPDPMLESLRRRIAELGAEDATAAQRDGVRRQLADLEEMQQDISVILRMSPCKPAAGGVRKPAAGDTRTLTGWVPAVAIAEHGPADG
jgi:hypothetical protein